MLSQVLRHRQATQMRWCTLAPECTGGRVDARTRAVVKWQVPPGGPERAGSPGANAASAVNAGDVSQTRPAASAWPQPRLAGAGFLGVDASWLWRGGPSRRVSGSWHVLQLTLAGQDRSMAAGGASAQQQGAYRFGVLMEPGHSAGAQAEASGTSPTRRSASNDAKFHADPRRHAYANHDQHR